MLIRHTALKIKDIVSLVSLVALACAFPLQAQNLNEGYEIKSTVTLAAEGPDGTDTYKLIRKVFGKNAIEAPDVFGKHNHSDVRHIWQEIDDEVGAHFVFSIHRDLDHDRDKYPKISDRQRNEIKTYKQSSYKVIGKKGETLILTWKFKMKKGMSVSKHFTHLFQLKAVDGNDSQPISTITARSIGDEKVLEIRHSETKKHTVMDRYLDLEAIQDTWLTVYCRATLGLHGSLFYEVTKPDGEVILHVDRTDIPMWRKGNTLVRPKWGIYRSLKQISSLRAEEETVRFADFTISKAKKAASE